MLSSGVFELEADGRHMHLLHKLELLAAKISGHMINVLNKSFDKYDITDFTKNNTNFMKG